MRCSLCGGTAFSGRPILWDDLINEWQLSRAEADYIDRQQGETCNTCGANLRSIALANAILGHLKAECTLQELVDSGIASNISILEINEAGNLTPLLKRFGGYVFGTYPELDMHAIPYPDETYDIVVHSDTLEHVDNPVHALGECRRVLKSNGALCFTVPTVVGRMSRNRDGLPKSFHGDPKTSTDDLVVRTEFGADAWTYVMEAGFTQVSIHAVAYPSATAMAATKNR